MSNDTDTVAKGADEDRDESGETDAEAGEGTDADDNVELLYATTTPKPALNNMAAKIDAKAPSTLPSPAPAPVKVKSTLDDVSDSGLLLATQPEKDESRRSWSDCRKRCCQERHATTTSGHNATHCYSYCCLPCRCCLSQQQIVHCERVYITIVHCLFVFTIIVAALFAVRIWSIPIATPNRLTVDYVLQVQTVNVTSNDTHRVFIAHVTPYAAPVRSSRDDPSCVLDPSGDPVVLRLSVTFPVSSSCHVYVESNNADGVRVPTNETYAWVSNSTVSESGLQPLGTDTVGLELAEVVQLI